MSRTVHIVDVGRGQPKVTLCAEGETPQSAFERIKSNIEHFGDEVQSIRTTWPIGESADRAISITFFAPGDGRRLPMWHTVAIAPDDEWAAKP